MRPKVTWSEVIGALLFLVGVGLIALLLLLLGGCVVTEDYPTPTPTTAAVIRWIDPKTGVECQSYGTSGGFSCVRGKHSNE